MSSSSNPNSAISTAPSSPPAPAPTLSTLGSSSKPKVLFLGHRSQTKFDVLIHECAEVHTIPLRDYEESVGLIREAVDTHGPFVAFGGMFLITDQFPNKWDQRLLGPLAPECKLYVGPGAGYDKVDVEWITSTGAMYANSPTEVGRRTADGALTLILNLMRGITPHDLSVRAGKWRDPSVRSVDWRTATIGIVGLGTIGSRVASLCSLLGMSIIYHSRRPSPTASASWRYAPSLDDLLQAADCVVLTCPLTPETHGLINRETLSKMKDGVLLVNVARGKVVVENDLVEALKSGKVRRAALDVFENEPEVHPDLLSNPNVTLSPHIAPAPDTMGAALNGEVQENVIAFVKTGMPLTPVNVRQLEARGFVLPPVA